MGINLKQVFVAAAASAVAFASAEAAPLLNGNFESVTGSATTITGVGEYRSGAVGWQNSGQGAGTFSPLAGVYDVNTGNVGVVNSGEALWQSTGVTLQSGGSYSFSGIYGNRNDFAPFSGSIGFYVGTTFSSAAIIAELVLSAPSVQGTLQAFNFALASGLVNQFAGQTLGVFIRNTGSATFTQLSVDNLAFNSTAPVVPVPAAAWLFGTVVAGAALRRRKHPAQ